MNRTILALALLTITQTTYAQQTVPHQLICDNTAKMTKTIREDFAEIPYWQGQSLQKGLMTTLYINKSTGSWTLAIGNKDYTCILDAGEGFAISLDPKPQDKNTKNVAFVPAP